MDKIIVSACIITYNHDLYIRDCLEGAINQKVNFAYEIIVGDDCSSDKTMQICIEYAKKYPDLIKLWPRQKNLGMIGNWIKTIEDCSGRYIALCEGDDFWTDPYKLQKQVDFLEANPEYAICFHRVFEKNELDEIKSSFSPIHSNISTFEDLIRNNNYIHTGSSIFRNNLFGEFPEWFVDCEVADYVLHLLNAQYGKIYFMEDTMAVYRINSQSTWGSKDDSYRYSKWLKLLLFLSTKFDTKTNELLFENIYTSMIHCKKLQIDINEFLDVLSKQDLIRLFEKGQIVYVQEEENRDKNLWKVKNSYDYKFGNILIQPLRYIKKLLNL